MIDVIVPKKFVSSIEGLSALSVTEYLIKPFSELTISFFNHLSREILKHPELRTEPAFAALGFWLRKTNLNKIVEENSDFFVNKKYVVEPLGLVFHVCPSNVDTMFFYSLVISMLTGNKNIVRISSKLDHPLMFELFEIIYAGLNLEDYKIIGNYINIIKYERNDEINQRISEASDGRIIWGGDETINQFKQYKTKPKVKDLFFADRISFTLLKTDAINKLNESELSSFTQKFYNDIYTFDQKGCSSPHCLFLLGNKKDNETALNVIYKKLVTFAEKNYDADIASISTFKFNQITEDIIENKIASVIHQNNYLILSELKESDVPETCGTGYLYFVHFKELNEIQKYIHKKVQSIGHFGLLPKELKELAELTYVKGVDRIIPVGKALDFDYIWDGYNILTEMVSLKTIN